MSFTRKCPECGGPMVPGAGSALGAFRCLECGRTERSTNERPIGSGPDAFEFFRKD